MNVIVREALPQDAPQIEALYELLTGKPCSVLPSRVADIAADKRTFLFVAERQEVVVGTVLLTLCLDAMYANQPFAVLENIVVDGAERNSGVGTALMRHAEMQSINSKCSKIMLLSAFERTDAHQFFSCLGYTSNRKVGFVKYRSQSVAEAAQPAVQGSTSPPSAEPRP